MAAPPVSKRGLGGSLFAPSVLTSPRVEGGDAPDVEMAAQEPGAHFLRSQPRPGVSQLAMSPAQKTLFRERKAASPGPCK